MSPELALTLAAVFGSVALATAALVSFALTQTAPGRRRLEQARRTAGTSVLLDNPSLSPEPSRVVRQLAAAVPRSPRELSRLRRLFVRAGFNTLTPLALYSAAQIVGPLLLGGLVLYFVRVPVTRWWLAGLSALIGFQLPSFVLHRFITVRQKVIQNGLPDALDLMIVCLEAGSSLDQAILKTSDELALAYPALAEELRLLITETRAGKSRLEAFRNLADRTGVDDVRALVSMLVQTDRFGTSVAQALRTHAEVSRTKRRQRAEERAAKIGVKLVFPLVFLLFPAFFTVTLGPAIIRLVRILFGQIMAE